MRCPRCRTENAPGARYCVACWAELPQEETAAAAAEGRSPPEGEPTEPLAPPTEPVAPPTEPLAPPAGAAGPPTEPVLPAAPTAPIAGAPIAVPPPPSPTPSAAARGPSVLGGGWGTATAWGLGAWAALALLGQLLAFGGALLSGAGLGVGAVARLGWLYFCGFHGIGVVAEVRDVAGPLGGMLPPGFGLSYRLEVAMLSATALALYLLCRGGRAAADRAGGGAAARVVHGLKVAPAYAVPALLLSLLVRFDLPSPAPEAFTGTITIRPAPSSALLWPLLLAAAAGAAGGLVSARPILREGPGGGRTAAAALAGGWTMLVAVLGLSFVGLLVHAAVSPGAAAAYLRAVGSEGPDGAAVALAHHVLLLPNQSLLVAAPAMGGCDGVYGSGFSVDLLCLTRFPAGVDLEGAAGPLQPIPGIPSFRTRPTPAPYFLFLLVPAASVALGGRAAARRVATSSEAIAAGALAGAVFAALFGAAVRLGSPRLGVAADLGGFGGGGSFAFGPELFPASLLALAWGAVGGALGALPGSRRLAAVPAPAPPPAAAAQPGPEER